MNKYTKLPLPKTEWNTPFHWVNWRIRYFFHSIFNIIRWIPTLFKDRDWDGTYILQILQKKIEFQRKYIVKANRHTDVDRDNYWMTVVLNLLDKQINEYYLDYEQDTKEYLNKYPSTIRKITKYGFKSAFNRPKKSFPKLFEISYYQQQKCKKLLYRILEEKLEQWWD